MVRISKLFGKRDKTKEEARTTPDPWSGSASFLERGTRRKKKPEPLRTLGPDQQAFWKEGQDERRSEKPLRTLWSRIQQAFWKEGQDERRSQNHSGPLVRISKLFGKRDKTKEEARTTPDPWSGSASFLERGTRRKKKPEPLRTLGPDQQAFWKEGQDERRSQNHSGPLVRISKLFGKRDKTKEEARTTPDPWSGSASFDGGETWLIILTKRKTVSTGRR